MSIKKSLREKLNETIKKNVDMKKIIGGFADVIEVALDKEYNYGMSEENSFGRIASLLSASHAYSVMECEGKKGIEEIADAIHNGWSMAVLTYLDQPEEKKKQRMVLVNTRYLDLSKEEQDKDLVAARAFISEYAKLEDGTSEFFNIEK